MAYFQFGSFPIQSRRLQFFFFLFTGELEGVSPITYGRTIDKAANEAADAVGAASEAAFAVGAANEAAATVRRMFRLCSSGGGGRNLYIW